MKRSLRQSQTLTPFGVGAICDLVGESFVGADIRYWKNIGNVLRAPRLERELGKEKLRSAPARPNFFGRPAPGIPYVRFPGWLFCSSCRRMVHWRLGMEEDDKPATCASCAGAKQLVPMRFVVACENGHLDDVPWHIWAHSNPESEAQKQCRSKALRFLAKREAGAGLETLTVKCDDCVASRSLQGITADGSLADMRLVCRGRQPWQRLSDAEPCEAKPRVVQRGASNVYFADVRSAIDIPPESAYSYYSSHALEISNHHAFPVILSGPDGAVAPGLKALIANDLDCSVEEVDHAVDAEIARRRGEGTAPATGEEDLQAEEWRAFLAPQAEHDERDRFITEHVDFLPEGGAEPGFEPLGTLIDRVVLARRLREVRALTGFRRYKPNGRHVKADLDHGLDWLPAVEVFGEGIFVVLREPALETWEQLESVRRRAQRVERQRANSFLAERFPTATPRFVLLHTLAHLLIRRLAYECGYAAASLRERIYAVSPEEGEPQGGILIYTAAGDTEGTLGGLARQGEPPRLARTLLAALQDGLWCSTDPICRESSGQGFASLNLAACHGCSLVSETSCVYSNTLLDRRLVAGEAGDELGFFSEPVAEALDLTREALAL